MAKDKFFDKGVVSLKGMTPEQQIKEIERLTEEVIERLPDLKHKLTAFDDRSDELYNLTPEEIRLFSKTYTSDIESGYTSQGLGNFMQQLQRYGETPLEELELSVAMQRWQSFKENILQVGGESEYQYVLELESKIDKRVIVDFTRSKFFFDAGDLSSDNFVKFLNEHGVSVGLAKLETYLESRGIKTDRKFFEEGVTRTKLGRPRKRKG